MKKRVLCLILVLVLAVSVFAGCSSSNEASQTIVTVGKGVYKETVTYSDLVSLFQNYGIYYVYYYGLGVEETLEMLLESLIENRTMLYSATQNLPKVRDIGRVTKDNKYEQFFTEEEYNEILLEVDSYISTLIDNQEKELITEKDEEEEDSDDDTTSTTATTETVRTTPSDFSYSSLIPSDFVGTETRKNAAEKFWNTVETNYGMTKDEYEEAVLESTLMSKVLAKYQEYLAKDITASDEEVQARYDAVLAKEKERYAVSASSYVDKLKTIQNAKAFSGENYVLYAAKEGYGFALNLLVKFSDEQAAAIEELQTKKKNGEITAEQYLEEREKLLSELVASDQRLTWLTNYGYNSELFDETPFDGTATPSLVDGVQTRDEEGLFKYDELSAKEYSFDEFFAKVNSVLGGEEAQEVDGYKIYKSDISKKSDFIDLIWQYGQDEGALNTEIGYVCFADDSESSFVEEYQAASKALAKCEKGSYVLVGTDYGYHIIYLVESYNFVGIVNEYKSSERDIEGTFSNMFAENVTTSKKSDYITNFATENNEKLTEEKLVKKNDKLFNQTVTIIKSYLSSSYSS